MGLRQWGSPSAWRKGSIEDLDTSSRVRGILEIEVHKSYSCQVGGVLTRQCLENVTLDPDTANPDRLDVCQDRKSVKRVKGKYLVPDPMGSKYHPCVLGCQTFSTGRHFWEVIVGGTGGWGVGVDSQSMNGANANKHTKIWEFAEYGGEYTATSLSECFVLVLTERPKRIRISLNCEGGQLAFFDASTATLLHSFSDASLVGETLQPCFYLGEDTCMTLPSKRGHP